MEFKVTTDLSVLPKAVEFNFEEQKAELEEKLAYYNGLIVTPDSIREAKEDMAVLRKRREACEERRKEIKRLCLAPYEAFEQKYKELLALLDAPIAAISGQIRAFDEQERQEKYDRLRRCFDNSMYGIDLNIDFDRILNPKWANKGMKAETLEKEICETVGRIRSEAEEIQRLYADSPHLTAVMNCYLAGYDKGSALTYAAVLVKQEQERIAAQKPQTPPVPEVHQAAPEPPAPPPEKLISGTFRVTGTRDQIIALRHFMQENDIQFEVVKEK